jgi:hypothetical protein
MSTSFRSLHQYIYKHWVILIFVCVVHANVSVIGSAKLATKQGATNSSPLKIFGSRILVVSIRTKRTNIPGTLVDEAVSYHLVLPFEAFATFGAWATFYWAIVRPRLTVDVAMRAGTCQLENCNVRP